MEHIKNKKWYDNVLWICIISYAISKMKNKNLDMIIANDVSLKDRGFGSDFNETSFAIIISKFLFFIFEIA